MTLAELRALLRLTLSSAAAWPDSTLDNWIGSAIRLYSAHFPRRLRTTISLAYGTQAYAVPGSTEVRGLISVEYPSGQSPPRLLRCMSEYSEAFAAGGACYALRGVGADDTSAVASLVFAEVVHDDETAIVEYWGPHPAPAAGTDEAVITVPAQHVEAISAYVEFAALYELEMDEALVTDGSTIELAQLGDESRRAWNRYKEVMDRLAWLGGAEVSTAQPCWGRYGL